MGLGERATFLTTPGESLPLEDASFDAALMVHVGMNIPDKQAVFTEVHRVLVAGGRFAVYEQMRTGDGELPYPIPWAEDRRSSFVETAERLHRRPGHRGVHGRVGRGPYSPHLGPPPPGPVSPMAIFGAPFRARIGNNVAATRAGRLGAILVIARA